MTVSPVAIIANAAVALALLVCYTVLTVTGHNGDPLLGVLGGQGLYALVGKTAEAVKASG